MMRIDQIWEELENDESLESGLLYKRYSGEIRPDIYVALKAPEQLRCIAALLTSPYSFKPEDWNKFQDIKLEELTDRDGRHFLLILLLNSSYKDVFSSLCEDLIYAVSDIPDEGSMVGRLIARLERWHQLFEKVGKQGLSLEAQRGLYGELHFLQKFLSRSNDPKFCVQSWSGVEKKAQDFQYGDWAVEVKTTHGKNHQKIQIASERQLDTSIIPNIYLVHFSLELREDYGESLNDIVQKINDSLMNSPEAQRIFRVKLAEAGYFNYHTGYYEDRGYSVRGEIIYRISEDFPRITEEMVPLGVGDVRYSIIPTENESSMIDEKDLFQSIGKPNNHD